MVDVSRRNQCQACRFRRCLEVNMKRDGRPRIYAPFCAHDERQSVAHNCRYGRCHGHARPLENAPGNILTRACLFFPRPVEAVQHERAPRGALKRPYGAEFMPPITAAAGPLFAATHAHSSTIHAAQAAGAYCPAAPLAWRPPANAVARPFAINAITPGPGVDSGSAAPGTLKEDEVSSSETGDNAQNRRLDDG